MPTAAVAGLIWTQLASLYGDLRERPKDTAVHAADRRSSVDVTVVETEQLRLPSHADPAGERLTEPSAVRHSDGRTYLALKRTPLSRDLGQRVVVVSSRNQHTWRTELVISTDQQASAPKLVSHRNQLLLFTSVQLEESGRQRPAIALSRKIKGSWTSSKIVPLKGHELLSVQQLDRQLLMTTLKTPLLATSGTEARRRVRAHTSADGLNWTTLRDSDLLLDEPGLRAAAFVAGTDGNLFAVMHGAPDEPNQPTFALCVSPNASWSDWRCEQDPLRLNNAALFNFKDHILVVGQRDVERKAPSAWLPLALQTVQNMLETETATKRCSVFRYNTTRRRLEFLLDLPSRGDNCSPSVLAGPGASDALSVIDYSSDIAAGDVPLNDAESDPTWIYKYQLRLKRTQPQAPLRQVRAQRQFTPKGAQVRPHHTRHTASSP